MALLRAIGWVLLVLGLIVLGRDLIALRDSAVFAPLSLYELWHEFARASLARLEYALAPFAWEMLRDALGLWAAPVLLLPGAILAAFARRRGARRRGPIRSPF